MPIGSSRAGILGGGVGIPDSAFAHYDASELGFSDGVIADPFDDNLGPLDLATNDDPLFRVNVKNGKNAVELDGADDFYSSPTFAVKSQPLTIFIVAKLDTATDDDRYLDNNGLQGGRIFIRNDSGSYQFSAGNNLSGGTTDTNWHILTAIFDGANSILRVDGVDTISGDAGSNSLEQFGVGGDDLNALGYLDGFVAEIVPCNTRLTQIEIDTEETRLSDKYAIPI